MLLSVYTWHSTPLLTVIVYCVCICPASVTQGAKGIAGPQGIMGPSGPKVSCTAEHSDECVE